MNGVVGGRYRVGRLLGEGGISHVYQATDLRLDRAVALKALREEFAGDPIVGERFAREARIAASLSHPNIVNIFDVVQEGNVPCIVMELVDGRPLRSYLESDAPFDPGDVVMVLDQLCDALDYAHSQGVVHRDLKPENILITAQGRLKIGDFGIARSVSAATVTQQGTVLGSVHYIAPEVVEGQAATSRSDIYAAGVMAYEMLTGLRPYTGDSAVAVALQHVEADPAPPSRINPRLPSAIDGAVLKAMARRPYERYATAAELAQAVAAALRVDRAGAASRPPADALAATIAMPALRAGGSALAMPLGGSLAARLGSGPSVLRTVAPRARTGGWTGLLVGVLGLLFVLLAFAAGSQVLRNLPSLPNVAPPSGGRPISARGSAGGQGLVGLAATRTPTPGAGARGVAAATETATLTPTVTETPTLTPTETETPPATPTPPPTWTPTPPRPTNTPGPTATPAPPPGMVYVPSLVGLTEEQAQQAIKNAGLTTTYPNYQTFNFQPPGHVLSQQPPAGSTVPRGTTVYIAVRR